MHETALFSGGKISPLGAFGIEIEERQCTKSRMCVRRIRRDRKHVGAVKTRLRTLKDGPAHLIRTLFARRGDGVEPRHKPVPASADAAAKRRAGSVPWTS